MGESLNPFRTSEGPLPDKLVELATDTLNEIMLTLNLERAVILFEDSEGWKVAVSHEFPQENFWTVATISRTILQRAIYEREPLLLVDALSDKKFQGETSVVISGLRSVACVPISDRMEQVRGLLYADNLLASGAFSQDDFTVLKDLANELGKTIYKI